MTTIQSIETRLFQVPLQEVLSDAKHGDHHHFELITATIRLSDGRIGTGYTYTGGFGGHAIFAMIQHDLIPFLQDIEVAEGRSGIEQIHDAMQERIHYVGRGGVSAFAIAALDIALWDIHCKTLNKPLWQLAGGAANKVKAYHGGIDLNFPLPKLVSGVEYQLERGFNAVKIKVGQPALADDVNRVQAVRKAIGDDITFMVDANYGMSVEQAITAAHAFKPYGLLWFEEPINPDEHAGYARIADETGIPLALGENGHTPYDFELILERTKLSYLQPDAGTCGGITGWLRASELAREYGVPISSHGMPELHVSLLAAQPHASWMEVHSFPIDQYTTRQLILDNHLAVAPEEPGIGVTFDWDKLSPLEVN